jgi:hypothetical protein
MIAASQRDAAPSAAATPDPVVDEPQRSTPKADRLPLFVPGIDTIQPETAAVAEEPRQPAARVQHERRDVCQHGRRYFRIAGHRYWRCRRR